MTVSIRNIRELAASYEAACKVMREPERKLSKAIQSAIRTIKEFYDDNDIYEEPRFGWVRDFGNTEIYVNTNSIGIDRVTFYYHSTFEGDLVSASMTFDELENLETELRLALAVSVASELAKLETKKLKEDQEVNSINWVPFTITKEAPKTKKPWVPILAA